MRERRIRGKDGRKKERGMRGIEGIMTGEGREGKKRGMEGEIRGKEGEKKGEKRRKKVEIEKIRNSG